MDSQEASSQDNISVTARVRSQAKGIIEEMIHSIWLRKLGTARANVNVSKHSGGTNAIILRADVQVSLFVKYHLEEVVREQAGHQILLQGPERFTNHLVAPVFIETDTGKPLLWLTPHARATPLHDLVHTLWRRRRSPPEWLLDLYDDVLESMRALWAATKSATPPSRSGQILRDIYVRRIYERADKVEEGLGVNDLKPLKVDVNGYDFDGKTLGDILDDYEDSISKIKSSLRATCVAHCDEHANNIMVAEHQAHQSPDAWLLIDYANARSNADWVYSIAKMLYWWSFYYVIERSKTDEELRATLGTKPVGIENETLIIKYDRSALLDAVPSQCAEFTDKVRVLAEAVAADFQEDNDDWRQRLKLAYFAVVFGAAALHFGEWRYAVPILLGEALEELR